MTGLEETRSEVEAKELVSRLGGSLSLAFTACSGIAPIDAKQAQIGDVVYLPIKGGNGALGICAGRDALFVDTLGEVRRVNMKRMECAWSTNQ